MSFYRKYNTVIRSIDNIVKLYKMTKKKDNKKSKNHKK